MTVCSGGRCGQEGERKEEEDKEEEAVEEEDGG